MTACGTQANQKAAPKPSGKPTKCVRLAEGAAANGHPWLTSTGRYRGLASVQRVVENRRTCTAMGHVPRSAHSSQLESFAMRDDRSYGLGLVKAPDDHRR